MEFSSCSSWVSPQKFCTPASSLDSLICTASTKKTRPPFDRRPKLKFRNTDRLVIGRMGNYGCNVPVCTPCRKFSPYVYVGKNGRIPITIDLSKKDILEQIPEEEQIETVHESRCLENITQDRTRSRTPNEAERKEDVRIWLMKHDGIGSNKATGGEVRMQRAYYSRIIRARGTTTTGTVTNLRKTNQSDPELTALLSSRLNEEKIVQASNSLAELYQQERVKYRDTREYVRRCLKVVYDLEERVQIGLHATNKGLERLDEAREKTIVHANNLHENMSRMDVLREKMRIFLKKDSHIEENLTKTVSRNLQRAKMVHKETATEK